MTRRSSQGAALALVVAGLCLFAPAAQASLLWDWSWSGTVVSGSGTLTTDPLSGGSYLVTAMTGTFDGLSIAGLDPTGTSFGAVSNDNLLYPSAPQLDLNGLTFSLANGDEVNIFFQSSYALCDSQGFYSDDCSAGMPGTFAATQVVTSGAVSEPASLAILGTGLVSLGILRRRKRAARHFFGR